MVSRLVMKKVRRFSSTGIVAVNTRDFIDAGYQEKIFVSLFLFLQIHNNFLRKSQTSSK